MTEGLESARGQGAQQLSKPLTHRSGVREAHEEAVTLWRQLAEADPARYTDGLADALFNLGIDRRQAGDSSGALAAYEEAVALRQHLAESSPAPPETRGDEEAVQMAQSPASADAE